MPESPTGQTVTPSELTRDNYDPDDWKYSPTQYEGVARFLTPVRLGQLLRDADQGDVIAYLTLAYEMERRDLHYRAVISQRKNVISQLVPEVVPASDNARDETVAKDVRHLVTEPKFRRLLFHLMDGVAKGYSIVKIKWETSESQWWPGGYEWRDQRLFRVDPLSLRVYRLEDYSRDGEALSEHGYIIHEAMLASGPALQNGLARPVMPSYLCKSYTVRDLMTFLQVYGIPVRLGRYPTTAGPEYRSKLLAAMRMLGAGGYGAIPEDMNIELLPSQKGGESQTFLGTAEYWDRQTSKGVLGQTSSVEGKAGGSYKADSHHKGVRLDIAAHDALDVIGTVLEQLIAPYVAFNYGAETVVPSVRLTVPQPEDLAAWFQALAIAVDRGHQVARREIDRRLGTTPPVDGEEVLEAAAVPAMAAPPPPNTADDEEE